MYYRCIRTCPTLWILLTFGVSFALFGYALYNRELPSFEDPLIGFEVRHSELSTRLNTWRLLVESTAWNGLLSLYPKSSELTSTTTTTERAPSSTKATSDSSVRARNKGNKTKNRSGKRRNGTRKGDRAKEKAIELTQLEYDPFNSKSHSTEESRSFFCGTLLEDYVHFVVEKKDGGNLLELQAVQDVCKLDQYLLRMEHLPYEKNPEGNLSSSSGSGSESTVPLSALSHFENYCEVKNQQTCCPSWSLSNYLLVHANKTDCDALSTFDIDAFVGLLANCSAFFADNYLNDQCATNPSECRNVPEHCYSHDNLVFNVFNYLVDYQFFGINAQILALKNGTIGRSTTSAPFLKSSSIFLPVAKSSKLLPYYDAISHPEGSTMSKLTAAGELSYGSVSIVAADLGLKYTLFSESLVSDLVLIFISGLIICGSLLLYTRSLLLTLTAILTNVSSLSTAYFLYTYLFDITFFPFLNLLSIIILIGVGSDNALIYCKAWSCVASPNSPLSKQKALNRRPNEYHALLSQTFYHVLVSTFVASLTTCCAFFSGYFTEITSLRCFSIFAGISIVTNFFITIITFPSAILLSEKWSTSQCFTCLCGSTSNEKNNNVRTKVSCLASSSSSPFSLFNFNQLILKLVFDYRFLIVAFFTCIAATAAYLIFYSPGLQLPTSQEFQVFSSQHRFERYDFKYKNEFWFSRFVDRTTTPSGPLLATGEANDSASLPASHPNIVLPIRVVFGVLPIDNGNSLDPFDRGKLQFDAHFNISAPESQVWLLEFCRDLRRQPFYRPLSMGLLLTNCFIETFKSWMEDRRCTQEVGGQRENRFPCCEQSIFPYEPAVFNQCLVEVVERLHRTPNYMFAMNRAGPRFDSRTVGLVKAIVIEYDSVYDAFATSFQDTAHMWKTVDGWVKEQLAKAPKGLQNGWFVTANTEFFALQQSLSSGVIRSLLISVALAFVTLVLTTWNLRLSILSTVSISFLIFSTIASLILLDWTLNVIESITISLTIGLAIDATLHYTIAYKMLNKENRILGIQMTLAKIGSPVAMGALTTFFAGFIMLFSHILAYIQIGTFLMILSVFSWLYSTLFHLSLLSIFGSASETNWISGMRSRLRSFFQKKKSSVRPTPNSRKLPNRQQPKLSDQLPSSQMLLTNSNINHSLSCISNGPTGQEQVVKSNGSNYGSRTSVCFRVTSV